MKQGWEIKKLGEVVDVLDNLRKPITKRDRIEGKYPYYGATGILSYVHNYIFSEKLVLIGEDGAKWASGDNTSFIAEGKYWVNNHAHVIRPNRKVILDEWIVYFLNFSDLTPFITGMTVPKLNQEKMRSIPIPLPPLPEQQRIVSILDEAFAAIAKAKANAEQNLKNARELFDSYLEDLFSILFRERDKRTVSELAKVIGGYSFKSTDFKKEGKYQVIRMGNVRPGIIREKESPVFMDELDDKVLSKALLLPNDVIITQTGTKKKRDYGFTAIIENDNYLLNQRIASIRFSDKYLPKFFLYFTWTNIFKDQYFANESGTVGQGNVGISAITDANVPFIAVKDQKEIVDKIDKLRVEIQKMGSIYQKKIDDLEELKKSILQKAFAGELQLSESGFAGL
jgi:type I restriction enzyme, S subunit